MKTITGKVTRYSINLLSKLHGLRLGRNNPLNFIRLPFRCRGTLMKKRPSKQYNI